MRGILMNRLDNLLDDWKFSLMEGEFVTKSSLERLTQRLRTTFHLVPFGNLVTPVANEVSLPEIAYNKSIGELLDYHGFSESE